MTDWAIAILIPFGIWRIGKYIESIYNSIKKDMMEEIRIELKSQLYEAFQNEELRKNEVRNSNEQNIETA